MTKEQLIQEFHEPGIKDMPEAADLNQLPGAS